MAIRALLVKVDFNKVVPGRSYLDLGGPIFHVAYFAATGTYYFTFAYTGYSGQSYYSTIASISYVPSSNVIAYLNCEFRTAISYRDDTNNMCPSGHTMYFTY